MNVSFSPNAWDDLQYWLETDAKTLKKILSLIKECRRTPFEGTGMPEPLRHDLSGYWSRRITKEHRMVYSVTEKGLMIAALRYHYD